MENKDLAPQHNKTLETLKVVPKGVHTVEEICDLLEAWYDYTGDHVSLAFDRYTHLGEINYQFYIAKSDHTTRDAHHQRYDSLAELLSAEWEYLRETKADKNINSLLYKRF